MVIKFSVSTSGYTENFIVRIWEAESDGVGAHVYETTLVEKNALGVPTVGAGHQVSEVVTANGMDNVVHIVRIYGAVSANLYNEFNYEPTTSLLNVFLPIQFKIGDGGANTPAVDSDVCTTPELAGLTEAEFTIHRNNYGFLLPDIPANPISHFTFNSGTGEWQLKDGDVFGPTEEFTIQRLPQAVVSVVNDSVVGKLFSGFVDVPANTSWSAGHLRKLIRLSGSPEYDFATDPPMHYLHAFQHFGAAGTATIKFTNGTLLYKGAPKASIDIPVGYEAAFTWDGTNWNIVYFVDSSVIDGAAIPVAGTVLGVGRLLVGDVPAGDPLYTIVHNLAISGDYMIIPTIETNNPANYVKNNKVGIAWHHHATDKANKVYVSLQEISAEVQDLYIAWVIIKR